LPPASGSPGDSGSGLLPTARNGSLVSPGQPCAISFHIERATGARHMRLAWSRIVRREGGRLVALDPGLYKRKLKELSRELEKKLGLKIVSGDRAPDSKTRAADRNEFEEARRLGTDLGHIRNTISDCLHRSNREARRSRWRSRHMG
jgi:hypothetical protein